jgi:hypothetical protein
MSRGKNKLFYNLFNEEPESSEAKKRNYLMPERDEAMMHRYYYHMVILRRRYEDALEKLSKEEFFISEHRIATVLGEPSNYKKVEILFREKPTAKELATLYPQWSWKIQERV